VPSNRPLSVTGILAPGLRLPTRSQSRLAPAAATYAAA
jgi:hypothetical protein